jgi:hypothetical protein
MRRLLAAVFTAALVLGGGAVAVDASATPAHAEELAPGGEVFSGEDTGVEGGDEDPSEGDGEPEPELLDFEAPTAPPAISGGTAVVGVAVQATAGTWAEEDIQFSFQWLRDGLPIDGADAQTYIPVPGDNGRALSVRVTADKAGYRQAVHESAVVPVKPGALAAGKVTISGTATVGQTLQAQAGTWLPSGTKLAYQWKRDGKAISGAAAKSYKLLAADLGKRITVTVTGTRDGYASRSATSAATRAVVAGALTTVKPKISGSAVVGKTLKAQAGTWKPAGVKLSYQWKRGGKAISGATKSSYTLKAADGGKRITVTVTGKLSGYQTASSTSASTATVLKLMQAAPKPGITGTAKVGSTLSARAGTWKPQPVKLSYQWLRDGKAIAGAKKASYKLVGSDAGKKITVRVTGSKSGYLNTAKVSAAKKVPLVMRASKPKISGSTTVGSTLTVNRGTWTSGVRISYQWYRNGAAVAGATGSSYRLGAGDVGRSLSVRVTGVKSGYASETRMSAATARVAYPTRTWPISAWDCPAWAPIKGNANSGIYHVPGGRYYSRTKPEECFATEAAAQAAGYRRSKL